MEEEAPRLVHCAYKTGERLLDACLGTELLVAGLVREAQELARQLDPVSQRWPGLHELVDALEAVKEAMEWKTSECKYYRPLLALACECGFGAHAPVIYRLQLRFYDCPNAPHSETYPALGPGRYLLLSSRSMQI